MTELQPEQIFETRFRIKRKLGEGGFGVVYEARDEPLNRNVALKVLKSSVTSDVEGRKRFLREGKILASLRSAQLVSLFSVNISSEGQLYMVMELLEGQTLRSKINEVHTLNEQETLELARSIVSALAVLEKAGVVHRDLKPDNIMIESGPSGLTKLLDFGLSGLLTNDLIKDSLLTSEGAMIGSVHYVSPELCIGEKATIQSDMYALGCIMYECLTGATPFQNAEPSAVIFKHVTTMPPSPVCLHGETSPPTQRIMLRLLQKEGNARFKNCADLADALEGKEYQDNKNAELTPFSSTIEKSRSHRGRIFIAAVLVLLIAVVSVVVLTGSHTDKIASRQHTQKILALTRGLILDEHTLQDIAKNPNPDRAEMLRESSNLAQNYAVRFAKLKSLLSADHRSHSLCLTSDEVKAIAELANHQLGNSRGDRAGELASTTLKCLESGSNLTFPSRLPLLEVLVKIQAQENAATKKNRDETAGLILKAVGQDEGFEAKKLALLLALADVHGPRADDIKNAIDVLAGKARIADLLPLRKDVSNVLEIAEQENPRNAALVPYAKLLVRLDKAGNDGNKSELLASDYLLLARPLIATDPTTASRYLDLSQSLFSSTGLKNADLVTLKVEQILLYRKDNSASVQLRKLDQLESLIPSLHGQERHRALKAWFFGWSALYANHLNDASDTDKSRGSFQHFVKSMALIERNVADDAELMTVCALLSLDPYMRAGERKEAIKKLETVRCLPNRDKTVAPTERYAVERCLASCLSDEGNYIRAIRIYKDLLARPEFSVWATQDMRKLRQELATAQMACGLPLEALNSFVQIPRWETDKKLAEQVSKLAIEIAERSVHASAPNDTFKAIDRAITLTNFTKSKERNDIAHRLRNVWVVEAVRYRQSSKDANNLTRLLDTYEKLDKFAEEDLELRFGMLMEAGAALTSARGEEALLKKLEQVRSARTQTRGLSLNQDYVLERLYCTLLRKQNKLAQAESAYQNILSQQKYNPEIAKEKKQFLWELGTIQLSAGNPTSANRTWRKIDGWQSDQFLVDNIVSAALMSVIRRATNQTFDKAVFELEEIIETLLTKVKPPLRQRGLLSVIGCWEQLFDINAENKNKDDRMRQGKELINLLESLEMHSADSPDILDALVRAYCVSLPRMKEYVNPQYVIEKLERIRSNSKQRSHKSLASSQYFCDRLCARALLDATQYKRALPIYLDLLKSQNFRTLSAAEKRQTYWETFSVQRECGRFSDALETLHLEPGWQKDPLWRATEEDLQLRAQSQQRK